LTSWFFEKNRKEKIHIKPVLLVKDIEDDIEYIIRRALNCDFIRRITGDSSLTVVDMGSTDDTLKILKKLSYEDDRITAVGPEGKDAIFDEFIKNDEKEAVPKR